MSHKPDNCPVSASQCAHVRSMIFCPGLLFVVLPRRCLENSVYTTEQQFDKLMHTLGFDVSHNEQGDLRVLLRTLPGVPIHRFAGFVVCCDGRSPSLLKRARRLFSCATKKHVR